MPRRRLPPRLYLDEKRGQWVIRDGEGFVRTGCAESDVAEAERVLSKYIARKYAPTASPSPPVADILIAYLRDVVPGMKSRSGKYTVSNLAKFWSDKTLAEVTKANCKAYAETRPQSAARADLETLRAAINHWHKDYGPLATLPVVMLPPKPEARERWLTREQAAHFLWAARRTEHLKRFIMIGLHTGTRPGTILKLEWSWLDLRHGTMRRYW
jgi:integrase